jgi:alkylated DNA nucleotide flippase Atl1
MTIASTRAQAVATILWELKRAEKLATLSSIAGRAGFSPGPSCRTVSTCLKTVRRDWPHLEWWRAVSDNGQLEEEQASFLKQAGFATNTEEDGTAVVASFEDELMSWEAPEEAATPAGVDA